MSYKAKKDSEALNLSLQKLIHKKSLLKDNPNVKTASEMGGIADKKSASQSQRE